MSPSTDVVLVHGWAFDDSVWNKLHQPLLGPRTATVTNVSLGFFTDRPAADPTSLPADAIWIGHSLGALWALEHAVSPRAIVAINGFACFHAFTARQVLGLMKRNIARDAPAQIRAFWSRAGAADYTDAGRLDGARLASGLDWLATWDARTKVAATPVLALAAVDDAIVPIAASRSQWPRNSLRERADGGHVLPLTRPEWCAAEIGAFLDALP